MLEKERRGYISCVVAGQKDLLPRELADIKEFETKLNEKPRKLATKKKKRQDGTAPGGEEGVGAEEADGESNLFESVESEETDDVAF